MPAYYAFFRKDAVKRVGANLNNVWGPGDVLSLSRRLKEVEVYMFPISTAEREPRYDELRKDTNYVMKTVSGN